MMVRFSRVSLLLSMVSLGACVDTPQHQQPLVGSVAHGETAVAARACAGCHEPDFAGRLDAFHDDTTYLPDTISYASNLTPDLATGIGSWSDAQIDVAIRVGVDGIDKPMCEPMPVYAMMADQEVADIIAYLRSLPPVAKAVPQSACPSQHGGPHDE